MKVLMLVLSLAALPLLGGSSQQQSKPPTVASMPPAVVSTTPRAGAIDVDPELKEIRVTFSKKMTDKSWSWSAAWDGSSPEMLSAPRFVDDGKTCVIGVKLEPGRTYGYWLNSAKQGDFKDAEGRPAVPYQLVFETKAAKGIKGKK